MLVIQIKGVLSLQIPLCLKFVDTDESSPPSHQLLVHSDSSALRPLGSHQPAAPPPLVTWLSMGDDLPCWQAALNQKKKKNGKEMRQKHLYQRVFDFHVSPAGTSMTSSFWSSWLKCHVCFSNCKHFLPSPISFLAVKSSNRWDLMETGSLSAVHSTYHLKLAATKDRGRSSLNDLEFARKRKLK